MMPRELRQLMERFNQLGRMLPQDPELLDLPEEPAGRAEVMIILTEMKKVEAQIDAYIDKHRCK
jgi:hypothetical protein